MAGWCLWEKTSCHQMGAGAPAVPKPSWAHHSPGSGTERLAGWSDRALQGGGRQRLWPEATQALCAQLGLVCCHQDRGQRCGINLCSCHGQRLPTLAKTRSQLSVAGEAQAPVPTEGSQPRDEGQEAVAPWPEKFGRCVGGLAAGWGCQERRAVGWRRHRWARCQSRFIRVKGPWGTQRLGHPCPSLHPLLG